MAAVVDKRGRSEGSEEENDVSWFEPRFLMFHLSLLKRLYVGVEGDLQFLEGSVPAEATVGLAHSFLRDRKKIIEAKKTALIWKGITKEARGEVESLSKRSKMSSPAAGPAGLPTVRKAFPASPPKSPASTATNFRMVSRYLEAQSDMETQLFEDRRKVYEPLLETTRKILSSIEIMLEDEQADLNKASAARLAKLLSSNPPSTPSNINGGNVDVADRSRSAQLSCKLRLWSLLHDDLKELF